jgi:hypothetical protein
VNEQGEARSGAVRFVANGATSPTVLARLDAASTSTVQTDDPVLILGKVLIKAFLASDPTKTGRDTLVVRKKVIVKLQAGNQTLKPLGDSDNKNNPEASFTRKAVAD